jgi:hypothetical protein
MVLSEKQTHKHTGCDFIDRKCPEQEDPETGSGLVGARAGGDSLQG